MSNRKPMPIETAPRDGAEIYAIYEGDPGSNCRAAWSDRPVCILGSRCGGFPPGWATPIGGDTDPNLPIDEPSHWLPLENPND